MSQLIRIYSLINPLNNEVFYIGATCRKLKTRLSGHISDAKNIEGGNIYAVRCVLINKIISLGLRPHIKLIKETSLDFVNHYESFYFRKFVKKGYSLLQRDDRFLYSNICTESARNKRRNGYVY